MWTLSGFGDEIAADLDAQCVTLNALGIGHLELRGAWRVNVLDLSDAQVEQVRTTLAAHAVRVSSIGSPIGKIAIADDFGPHLVRFDRALDLARRLDAPFVRIFSFFMPPGDDPAVHRDEVIARLRALVERCDAWAATTGHPVTLVHENEKDIYGDSPERCHDILSTIDSPRLRAVWDPANFVQVGSRPFTDGYALLRPYIAYLHIKDAHIADGSVVVAGAGDGQVADTLDALQRSGYDGFLSLEPHLASAGAFAGFSGPQRFAEAAHALTDLLRAQSIPWA